jgi:sulfopyruvate decarboxylase alpha subunit
MQWAESIVACLKEAQVRFINYLPDAMGEQILRLARSDSAFELLPLAREEEGVGVVAGQWLGGARGVLVMPVSGLGNSLNALASLAIPYKFPLPMVIAHRGDLGEFNQTQIVMGQTAPEILHSLRIPYFELRREEEVEKVTSGALRMTYSAESPVAIMISTQVAGWKE